MTDQPYDVKIQDALSAAEKEKKDTSILTLSSGVQLKSKKVPVLRIQAILNRFKYPPVPEIWDENKERMLRNPNHPLYLEQRQQVDMERTVAIIDAVAAVGTELHYKPDHIPGIEDDSWIDECSVIGIEINQDSPTARYLAWIKYVAIKDQEDVGQIARHAGLNLGVSEERVAAALQGSFQDN